MSREPACRLTPKLAPPEVKFVRLRAVPANATAYIRAKAVALPTVLTIPEPARNPSDVVDPWAAD